MLNDECPRPTSKRDVRFEIHHSPFIGPRLGFAMALARIALLNIRLVLRTKVALFFTFLFPLVFLFAYAGLFAHGNPQAVAYMFGPVVTLNIMGSGFWGLGMQSVVQRERGSLRRYRLAPIGPGTIVGSNLLANFLLELPTIGLLVICARLFFHMPLRIGWLTLLILVTVGTLAFAGFGLTIASLANTMQEAQIFNNLSWLTLLFLSGTTVPLPLLPHWIQRLATFLPATYLVSAFQAIMVQSQPLLRYWPEMLGLAASGLVGLLAAWKLFRWEKEERIARERKLWALAFVVPFLLIGGWMNTRANPMASWAMSYYLMGRGGEGFEERASAAPGSLIEDFEKAQSAAEVLGHWQVSSDSDHGFRSVSSLSLVSPGAVGTGHALRIQGRFSESAAGRAFAAARYRFTPPATAKVFTGIEFWVRGDTRLYEIKLLSPDSTPESAPSIRLAIGRDWQSVRLPVGQLAELSARASAKTPWILEMLVSGPPGEFSVEIDAIKFY